MEYMHDYRNLSRSASAGGRRGNAARPFRGTGPANLRRWCALQDRRRHRSDSCRRESDSPGRVAVGAVYRLL